MGLSTEVPDGATQRHSRICGYLISDPDSGLKMFQDLVQPIYKGGRGHQRATVQPHLNAQRVHTKPLKAALGFEYITEMKGIKLFRKPKRFNV